MCAANKGQLAASADKSPPAKIASAKPSFWKTRRAILLCAGIIILGIFISYRNSFSVPFIYDDRLTIIQNPTIKELSPSVLAPPPGSSTGGRPMVNLSLAINYAMGGTSVEGYHLLNMVIHILAGLALFGIVRRTLHQPVLNKHFEDMELPLALLVALLWALHPLQTEAVTYTIQRAESMMAMFYLLTLYCFIRGAERSAPGVWYILSIWACFLGMASKEVMVSAPLIVFLYDRTFVAGSFRQALKKRTWVYAGLASSWLLLIYLVASTGGNRAGAVGFNVGISWWAYALTQFKAIAHYLWLSIWPHHLVFEYGKFWVKNVIDIVPYALVIIPLIAGTMIGLWRWPMIGFAGFWFFSILAPTSLMPGTTQMIVEHRMYLALAPVLAVIVLGSYQLTKRHRAAFYVTAGTGFALAVALGVLTSLRNDDYRSRVAIWADTVAKRPNNAVAHNNLALALADAGHLEEAIREDQIALQLRPLYPEAHYDLGSLLAQTGRIAEALPHFEEAVRLNPRFAEAHNNLGTALFMSGRAPEAVVEYKRALRLKPDYPEAQANLERARMALEMQPSPSEALYSDSKASGSE